jgi:ribosome-associated heat shock protein Hsp15
VTLVDEGDKSVAQQKFQESMRLDKWLWVARFFKTRSAAAEAVSGGKVHLAGMRIKPSHAVRAGDELKITGGLFESRVIVRSLSLRRGPASEAQQLYEETEQSKQKRAALAEQLRMQGPQGRDMRRRPSKKARRDLLRFTRSRMGQES